MAKEVGTFSWSNKVIVAIVFIVAIIPEFSVDTMQYVIVIELYT